MATLTPTFTLTSADAQSDAISITATDSLTTTEPTEVSKITVLHSGETVITEDQALEESNGYSVNAYQTIRVKPNDLHGGTASKFGGAFISIQHWLNDVDPTHVSSNWDGASMGSNHADQAKLNVII